MRRWEIVVLAVVAYGVLVPAATGRRTRRGLLGWALAIAVLIQLVVEGYRWPLVPLYVAAAAVAAGDAFNEERKLRGLLRVRQAVVALTVLGVGAVAPVLIPVPVLPPPLGPLGVGTVAVTVVDPERPMVDGGPAVDGRALPVRIWYPARVPAGSEPAPWTEGIAVVGVTVADRTGVPAFLFSGSGSAPSHSFPDAEVLSGRFPLLVYVHPAGGFSEIAVDLLEGLASAGYVVVAADHPSLAALTRYDGGVAVAGEGIPPPGDGEREAALEDLVATAAADVVAVLDAVSAGPSSPFSTLADHVDVDRIGVIGHGIGGGAAVRACLDDQRCDVVVGLDPWVGPVPDRLVARELTGPALIIRSGEAIPDEGRLRGIAERSPSIAYWVRISGLIDTDMTALRTLTPLGRRLGLRGELDPVEAGSLVGREVAAFVDRHLAGIGGARLDDPPPPGVERDVLP